MHIAKNCITLLLILTLCIATEISIHSTASSLSNVSILYTIDVDGTVRCRITVSDMFNETTVNVCVKDDLIPYSIIVYDENREPLDYEYIDDRIVVYTYNQSTSITIEYIVNTTPLIDNIVSITLKPCYRARVLISKNVKLLGISIDESTPNAVFTVSEYDDMTVLNLSEGIYHLTISLQTYVATTTTPYREAYVPTISWPIIIILSIVIVSVVVITILRKRRGSSVVERHGRKIPSTFYLDSRDLEILKCIAQKPKSISDIAKEIGLSKSTVWRRIQRLKNDGFIELRSEGRRVIVVITDKGLKALQRSIR